MNPCFSKQPVEDILFGHFLPDFQTISEVEKQTQGWKKTFFWISFATAKLSLIDYNSWRGQGEEKLSESQMTITS